ncbi:glycoside hydrolase family 3 C-terminal domain-containing protein, partial [Paenibacillus sp.]|uniref:glycoside hydrolase family 3 C-terminal domain-containing protein n=1 Tax=Paenibacillus sp. TaxID=58172 RepID=UPI002D6C03FD
MTEQQQLPAYRDESLSFEERAKDLVSRMTLREKASQMIHKSCAIPHLGIETYNWWNEALHGVARAGTATMFPQAIGMAATFDEALLRQVGDVVATEGRAKHHEAARQGDRGIYKGLTFWAPNINIFRDPRWGRGHETYGEDPYLSGRLGVAYIRGLQGDDPRYLKTAACAKHYAVHSGPENERHRFNAVVSKKDLYETYLPAFRDCVVEGKVEAIMGAYNRVNGEPCCGSKTLLQDILRGEWGFQGHVVSDCWAIVDFHEGHGVTSTEQESCAYAINNGCDLNCGSMFKHLVHTVENGMVSEETLDRALTRLIMTRMKLGMFDDPAHVPYASIPYEVNDSPEHNAFALEVSKRTMVLLKNDGVLPLSRERVRSIAVIGPNAASKAALVGNYEGTASEYVTVLDGIREAVGGSARVYYAEGCELYAKKKSAFDHPKTRFAEALSAAQRADVVVVVTGLDATIEGEEFHESNDFGSGDKASLELPGLQQELLEAVHAVGKPVVLVNLSGSALALTWADEHIPAIVQGWYPGAQGGRAIASLLFGEYSPSGKLPVTFYRSTEELPDFRDYSMKGRTYRYMTQEALYPFGYGLSYTRFAYERVEPETAVVPAGAALTLRAKVRNVGEAASIETAQLYVRDVEASVDVPKWQLRGIR